MAKFLSLWRANLNAPWPQDPAERAKLNEMLFAATESGIKAGQILESGYFLDGTSGFNVRTGESKDVIMAASSVLPWIIVEVREMLPIETAKEAMMGALKARAEAMAAMKR
jgi:hypothetical protein